MSFLLKLRNLTNFFLCWLTKYCLLCSMVLAMICLWHPYFTALVVVWRRDLAIRDPISLWWSCYLLSPCYPRSLSTNSSMVDAGSIDRSMRGFGQVSQPVGCGSKTACFQADSSVHSFGLQASWHDHWCKQVAFAQFVAPTEKFPERLSQP